MKIIFITNFLNHHQLPCALEFIRQGVEYILIATEPVPNEQLTLGYADMNHQYDFVLRTYDNAENIEKAKKLLLDADVVIADSCCFPFEWLTPRLELDKLTFWASERLYKHGALQFFYPPTFKRVYTQCTKFRKNRNYCLLCYGCYVAKDYKRMCAFPNKIFKWGYFPKVEKKNINELMQVKSSNGVAELLWVARFIKLKHPEVPIKLMVKLKNQGINAHLTMVGTGELFDDMKLLATKLNVIDNVTFTGAVPFGEVREYMDRANIFLFTSNRIEGWGAVINEAMNSGCAVIVHDIIGSSKYLINKGENGYVYHGNRDFYDKVITLIQNKDKQVLFGKEAYKTISQVWCAENAVNNLVKFINGENIKGNQPVGKE